jgi:hypothetical protein
MEQIPKHIRKKITFTYQPLESPPAFGGVIFVGNSGMRVQGTSEK